MNHMISGDNQDDSQRLLQEQYFIDTNDIEEWSYRKLKDADKFWDNINWELHESICRAKGIS